MDIESVKLRDFSFEETISNSKLLHRRVFSKSGAVVGRVSQVRIDPEKLKVEGILIKGSYKKPIYMGRSYIDKVSSEAITLSIDPSILLLGKRVITYEGQILGKVREVSRQQETNEINEIIVGSLLKRPIVLPAASIEVMGKSIILHKRYNVRPRYIWQKA